jgi:hypothetical protein
MVAQLAALQDAVARHGPPARPSMIVEDRTDRARRGPVSDTGAIALVPRLPSVAIVAASASSGKSGPLGSRT